MAHLGGIQIEPEHVLVEEVHLNFWVEGIILEVCEPAQQLAVLVVVHVGREQVVQDNAIVTPTPQLAEGVVDFLELIDSQLQQSELPLLFMYEFVVYIPLPELFFGSFPVKNVILVPLEVELLLHVWEGQSSVIEVLKSVINVLFYHFFKLLERLLSF